MQTVTYRQFDSFVRRTVRKTMKEHGRSLSETSAGSQYALMRHGAKIITIHPDLKTMDIEGDWKKAVCSAALDFAKPAQEAA